MSVNSITSSNSSAQVPAEPRKILKGSANYIPKVEDKRGEIRFQEAHERFIFSQTKAPQSLEKREIKILLTPKQEEKQESAAALARIRKRLKEGLPEPKELSPAQITAQNKSREYQRMQWTRDATRKFLTSTQNGQEIGEQIARIALGHLQELIQNHEITEYEKSIKGLSPEEINQLHLKFNEIYCKELLAQCQAFAQQLEAYEQKIRDAVPARGISPEEYAHRMAAIEASRKSDFSTTEVAASVAALTATVLAVTGLISLFRT